MKMPEAVYNELKANMRLVIEAIERGEGALRADGPSGSDFDRNSLTLRDLWDIHHKIGLDRANQDHPFLSKPGLLPRVIAFDDRSPYDAWGPFEGGVVLNDSHIETALKAAAKELAEEPRAETAPTL